MCYGWIFIFELSGWEFVYQIKNYRIGKTGVTSSNFGLTWYFLGAWLLIEWDHCWVFYFNEVAFYTFFSHRLISVVRKHSKLWPFSPIDIYDVWILLTYAPYLNMSPSFLSMLTEYACNTMGRFRKKHFGWGHGILGGWGKWKYLDFQILSSLAGNDLGPLDTKCQFLTSRTLRRVCLD